MPVGASHSAGNALSISVVADDDDDDEDERLPLLLSCSLRDNSRGTLSRNIIKLNKTLLHNKNKKTTNIRFFFEFLFSLVSLPSSDLQAVASE